MINKLIKTLGKTKNFLQFNPQLRILIFVYKNRLFVLGVLVGLYYLILMLAFAPLIMIASITNQQLAMAENLGTLGERKDPAELIGIKGTLTEGKAIMKDGKVRCYEPIFKPNNSVIWEALKAIKCAEFGNLPNNEANISDRDSCGAGQQRVSEFYSNKDFQKILAGMLSKGEFEGLFNPSVKSFVVDNKENPRYEIGSGSGYGFRGAFTTSGGVTPDFHDALDFNYNFGTPVFATHEGMVETVKDADKETDLFAGLRRKNNSLKYVTVKHINPDYFTSYLHLSGTDVNVGDTVTQGQLVGLSGSTGMSTAPHLHYSIYKEWGGLKSFNPLYALDPSSNYQENLIYVKKPFVALCRMLQNANIKTGVLDVIMIQRLKNEFPELFNMTNVDDKEKFINKLCATQRPVEFISGTETCRNTQNGWLDRARNLD
jgi:murein DD-endopeptidase MepM/ murein hydrolase activator NlpD